MNAMPPPPRLSPALAASTRPFATRGGAERERSLADAGALHWGPARQPAEAMAQIRKPSVWFLFSSELVLCAGLVLLGVGICFGVWLGRQGERMHKCQFG